MFSISFVYYVLYNQRCLIPASKFGRGIFNSCVMYVIDHSTSAVETVLVEVEASHLSWFGCEKGVVL